MNLIPAEYDALKVTAGLFVALFLGAIMGWAFTKSKQRPAHNHVHAWLKGAEVCLECHAIMVDHNPDPGPLVITQTTPKARLTSPNADTLILGKGAITIEKVIEAINFAQKEGLWRNEK